MAIEEVTIYQNTSIMQDEVLAHRLGLIPIGADPRLWAYLHENEKENNKYNKHNQTQQQQHSEIDLETSNQTFADPLLMDNTNTLVFKLLVQCKYKSNNNNKNNKNNLKNMDDLPVELKYEKCNIYSSDIEWVPQRGQIEKLKEFNHQTPISCVYNDILLAKLRPGQTIEASMKAIKGKGKDHAKWSPVGTAFYKLLPKIEIINDNIFDNEAKYFYDICPQKVFDIEDLTNNQNNNENNKTNHQTKLKVARPRDCTMCRACIDHSSAGAIANSISDNDKIKLRRVKDHFICFVFFFSFFSFLCVFV